MHNVYACRYADLRARAQLTVEDARSGLPFVTGSQRPAPSRAPAPSSRRPLAPGHARRALRVGKPRRRSEPVMRVGRGGGGCSSRKKTRGGCRYLTGRGLRCASGLDIRALLRCWGWQGVAGPLWPSLLRCSLPERAEPGRPAERLLRLDCWWAALGAGTGAFSATLRGLDDVKLHFFCWIWLVVADDSNQWLAKNDSKYVHLALCICNDH